MKKGGVSVVEEGIRHRDQTHLLQRPVSTSGGDTVADERPKDEQHLGIRCEVEPTSGQHEEVNKKDWTQSYVRS